MRSLRELERAFFRAVAVPSAASDGPPDGLLAEIRGDERLDAAGRVEVYARMYVARLTDVLRADFPRVAAIVGHDDFTRRARDYVAAYPSTHPSLRWFGRRFPDFLREHDHDDPPFLADLAGLEWARLAVFDAPDAVPLRADDLRQLAPEAWATLRLRVVPALELLHAEWPVHRIWDADAAAPPEGWQHADTWLRVWRQEDRVYQAAMDETERTALRCVQGGDDFAAVCGTLAASISAERAAATAGGLVLRWIEDGILSAATTPA